MRGGWVLTSLFSNFMKHTLKWKKLMSEHMKAIGNRPPSNKGKHHSEETKKKISNSHKGKKASPQAILKMKMAQLGEKNPNYGKFGPLHQNFGKKQSIETRIKRSQAIKGDKHYNWRGGITAINKSIRISLEYKLWREAIFQRDDYTCQMCGKRGIYLEADHIKPFAFFPKLRFEVTNGRSLCKSCHSKTDTYKRKAFRFMNI